ncbi:Subunit of heteropentameric Replication factor C (RF-C), partial [Gonapodya sp. JEL0774]
METLEQEKRVPYWRSVEVRIHVPFISVPCEKTPIIPPCLFCSWPSIVELYGPEVYKARVLELNASDERGIDVIRAKVKNFARVQVSGVQGASSRPLPPYKIIILDEADSMTNDAQSALRRTMEQYSKITRFCLVCNYVSR